MDYRSGKSQELYKQAKRVIPGGTQLLSKRPEMFLPDGHHTTARLKVVGFGTLMKESISM